jgi:hypothetical protein
MISTGDRSIMTNMHKTWVFATSSLALLLGACTPKAPADGDEETSGDSVGDLGDGDGDGDSGDGDGDPCSCPGGGSFDQCGVQPPIPLDVTFGWPSGTQIDGPVDEICTVFGIDPGVTATFDCPSGVTLVIIDTEPAWVPAFAVGEQVRVRASTSFGMAEGGEGWPYTNFRVDRADDSAMLVSYVNSRRETPNFIDDTFATEIVTGLCEPSCGSAKTEPVAVRFFAGDEQLELFAGQIGELGEHRIQVAQADSRTCTDSEPGRYRISITHTNASADACALVLDQSYSSQEQLECGLGPNGPELCNWTISFDGSQYAWHYSDVGQVDDYGCAGLELLSVPDGEVLGSISADGSLLTWDDVPYNRD